MRKTGPQLLPTLNFTEAERSHGEVSTENLELAVKLFRSAGCLLVERVFPPEFIDNLRTSFLTEYSSYCHDLDFPDAPSTGDKRLIVTVTFKAPFNTPFLYANALLHPIIRAILEPAFILNSFGCVLALPGAAQQHIHQEGWRLFSHNLDRLLPCYALMVITPLVDLNEHNGTTRVYPGTHLSSNKEEAMAMNYQEPVIPVGSCLLADYRLYHGGTPTLSEQARPILLSVYSRPWYRDYVYFNHAYAKQLRPLRIDLQEYEKVPEEFRHMFVAATEFF